MSKALRVCVLLRNKTLKSRTFHKERLVIGREPECDLNLFHVGVSRRHAIVERREEGYVLRDLGSTNGTYVNDRAIQVWPIEPGTKARIHLYELVFTLVDGCAEHRSEQGDVVAGFGDDKTMYMAGSRAAR